MRPKPRKMVVFHQDRIKKPDPVIRPSPTTDRVFLKRSESGQGLAGIENLGRCSRDRIDILAGQSRDATQKRQKIQNRPFGRQQGPIIPSKCRNHRPGRKSISIDERVTALHRIGEFPQDQRKNHTTAQDTRLPGDNSNLPLSPFRDERRCRQITLTVEVFAQSRADQFQS